MPAQPTQPTRQAQTTKPFRSLAACTLAALGLSACVASGTTAGNASPPAEPSPALRADLNFARSLSNAFQHAAATASPSLVHITSRSLRTQRDFLGRPRSQRLVNSGLGSGFVYSAEGHIVTNNHVVAQADDLMVRLANGRELTAELVGADALHDVAVLKVDTAGAATTDLVPLELASSSALAVGEWVLALGSPFGLDSTVTAGIVSAKGRGIARDESRRDFEDYIQTDAAINPGNSGGPLIDLEGRVVGVNTAIFSRSGGSNGIGFAIPIDLARTIADSIIRDGYADRGWLGVSLTQADGGVRVTDVIDGSPAQRAGVRIGDVITAFRDRPTDTPERLISAIGLAPAGTRADLTLERNGQAQRLAVTLAGRERANAELYGIVTLRELGVRARPVDERLPIRVTTDEGVFIEAVFRNSLADRTELEPGDVIVAVDERAVRSPEDLRSVLESADLDRGVRLDVVRGERRGYLELTTTPRRLTRIR